MVGIWVFLDEHMSKQFTNSCTSPGLGEGTDSEDSDSERLAFHHQGPTFINAYSQAAKDLVDRD